MKSFSESTVSSSGAHLIRALGAWMATAVVVGNVIGAGVFVKPAAIAKAVPSFGWAMAAWVLLGVLTMCGGLALAEVMVMYPKAGGNYVYLREGYGRLFGFLWGWIEFFVIRSASIAALATIFAESLHDVLRHPAVRESLRLAPTGPILDFWPLQGVTVVTIVVLSLVNARGVTWGGGLQLVVTTAKIGSLLFIALLPFVFTLRTEPAAGPHWDYLSAPAFKSWSWLDFGAALIAIQWAYYGWTSLAPVAEEVTRPQRNLPLAIIVGIGIIIALYLAANLAYSVVLSQEEMAKISGTSVAAEFATRLLGPNGGLIISIAIGVSVFGAMNGGLMAGPRLLYAMGVDKLAPARLAAIHPRYKTPAVASTVLAAWTSAMVLIVGLLIQTNVLTMGKNHFDVLSDFAVFGSVLFETLAVASIFLLRWKRPDAERPYRCIGYPWVPLVYVLGFSCVLASYAAPEKQFEAATGLGFTLVGAVVYGLFLRGSDNMQA
jgi:basic amino acid/polyamine antiporter, APA family